MNALRKQMEQLAKKYVLGETMCTALSEWFESRHVQLQNYPTRYHSAIWIQGAIGLQHILNRKYQNFS